MKRRRTALTVVVTGAGSGGHITPALAVAHALKQRRPDARIVFVGQKGDTLGDVPAENPDIDAVYTVRAGKLRRYHGESLIKQLLDIPTVLKNIRDVVWVAMGLWQSFWLLRRLKPDVIFIKGGFVGVPLGLSAALLRQPYITHDSDALPGLANRIVAPWARLHTVALPKDVYTYPPAKTITVGVPISHEYHSLTPADVTAARRQVGLERYEQVLLLVGGGNGSEILNNSLAACAPALLARYPRLAIVQQAGRALEADLRRRLQREVPPEAFARVFVKGFVPNLYAYSAAANVVISRAGSTSMAEFAAQGKACVVVPNPVLTGGHQLKNAQVLAERKAVKVVDEARVREDAHALMPALTELLDHPEAAATLGAKLASLAVPDAAGHLAVLLLEVANEKNAGKPQ